MSPEETERDIQRMGYVTCSPRTIKPSYYKLKNGTIIAVQIVLGYITSDDKLHDSVVVSSTQSHVFVPKENRQPEQFQRFEPAELLSRTTGEDVEFETLCENSSTYDLSNGTVVSAKAVVVRIQRTGFFMPQGEPAYRITTTPVFEAKKGPAR